MHSLIARPRLERSRGLRRWGRLLAAAVLSCLPALAWAVADPQIASLVDDDPVVAGATYNYTVRVANNGTLNALNTRLRLAVPTGASFVSAAPAAANCVATSATQIDCDLGTVLAAGVDERTVVFTWRATVAGLATVNATATVLADNDANPGNNSDSTDTTVTRGSNLALALSGAPNPVVGGAPVTYTHNVSHTGPNGTDGLVLTQALSPSSSFVSANGTGWTCSHTSGTVTCVHPGPFALGASIPPVTVLATANAASGTITSSASVAHGVGGPADPVADNNTAVANTSITPGADLTIADMAFQGSGLAVPGQSATLLVLPRNLGPATGSSVSVVTTLPAGWTVTGASGPGWACTVATLSATCTRASLAVGNSNDITVLATAPVVTTSTSYTATAQISSASTADPVSANNSRTAGVTVRPDGADLVLRKAKSPNPVALGATLTSEIRVGNFGPRVATGPLRVVDVLNGETFSGFGGSGWACTASGAVVTCDHPNPTGLGLGDQLPTLSITTTATVAGTLSNTACTGGSVPPGAGASTARPPLEGDPNPSNDCETASSVSTTVRPDLAITKTTSTPTGGDKVVAASEASVTYTLQVSNVSGTAEAATGVRISDTVPGFITGRSSINLPVATVSTGSAVFSCTVSGATVDCSQTAGQLLPGQAVTVPITVNRPLLDGSFTNTATVGNVSEGDPVAANNSASDTVTILPIADVAVQSKSITPAGGVRAGENATYVISYLNNGPSTAAGVVLTDSFTIPGGDAGLTVVSIASSAPGSSCGIAPGAQITAAASSFSCTIGSLVNGQAESITLVVRPNWQVGNAARSIGNTAAITTTTAESPSGGDNGNNSQAATLLVAPAAIDLLVNTTDVVDPVPFQVGDTFLNHRVRVTSGGPSFGTNVRFSQVMTPPAGKRVRFVCDTTTAGGSTCNPTPLCTGAGSTSAPGTALPAFSCQLPAGDATMGAAVGELANGQSKEVFLRFEVLDQPVALGDVFNTTSTVSANEPDVFAANNSDGEATTTRQRIDLRVSKAASVASVALRQPFNWVITVANNGPGSPQQTDLTDTLPAGTELTGPVSFTRSLPAGNGSCTVSGLTVSCALGVLDANGVATVTVPVRLTSFPAGGSLNNTATVDNRPETTGAIDLPGNNNTGTAAVAVTRASISGLVFEDRDRSGGNGGVPQAAAAEPRIAGVTVRLQGTDAFGNPVDLSTPTDSNGQYSFADLSPSDASGYRLTQTQPAGHANSPAAVPASGADAPSAGGSYSSGGAAGNSGYTGIVLAAGTDALRYHFPEVRAGSLSGFVYLDINNNGSRDPGSDPAIAGAAVRLLNAATGAVVASTSTDASGAYSFSALDPLISYTLEQPLPGSPADLLNGPVNPGLVNGVACASGCAAQANAPAAGTDRIGAISLSSGEDGTQFNFGELQQAAISGTVFIDRNRNNTIDPVGTDGRLGGVTLTLYPGTSCTGAPLASTSTDADGNFSFSGLVAGLSYTVCQTQPAGYADGGTTPGAGGSSGAANAITITNLPAGGSAGNLFAELLASLAGSVYADHSPATPANTDNGVRDAGEVGIAGVTVTLSGRDSTGAAVNRSTTSDASGNWRFDDLLPSDASGYTVSEGALPAAAGSFNDGRDSAGTAGGTVADDRISAIVLPAGAVATGYTFGELPLSPISGTVFIDRNRNNTIDPAGTDGRLGGVTLTLYPGTSCTGTPLASTTTDADGNFSFSGLVAGLSYTVCQTQPAGYADGGATPGTGGSSSGTNAITIGNLPAGGSAGNLFAELLASLAGSVYADHSPAAPANTDNGVRDVGEAGVAGVTVTLSGRDSTGAAVNRSTTSDASGNWRFDDLLPSDASGYTVSEGSLPAAAGSFNDGRDSAGSAGGTVANDRISAIVLPAGAVATGYTFGELPASPISGTVFIDRNRNNTIDPAGTDGRLGGVTLTLYPGSSCTGTPLASTTTDASGNFSFANTSAGLTYTVCQTQPAGHADGGTTPGAGGSSGAANAITISNLPAGGSAGNLFAERLATLAGSVYLDANHDGQRAGTDTGLAGVAITLSGSDVTGAAVSRSTSTDASGNYRFDDLLAAGPGGYTLTEQTAQPAAPAGSAPAGTLTLDGRTTAGTVAGSPLGTASALASTPSRISAITLPAGAEGLAYNFGEILPVGLSGAVFTDLNNNGQRDTAGGDAGLGGVTLVITGTDDTGTPVVRTVVTAPDGSFALLDLRPGTYTLTQPTQPAGTSNGLTVPGSAGGAGTPVATPASAIGNIVLGTPGQVSTGNLFAEVPANSVVAGRVWLDSNHNGLVDGAETGIAGQTITLSGTDTAGRPVNLSTTTDATGAWRFEGLAPGNYSITQPAQPAGTLNGNTRAGTGGGNATGIATSPSAISGIVLGVNQSALDNLFGEVPAGAVSGRVWADNNNNATVDAGETGLAGVPLVLTGTDDLGQPVNRNTSTAGDGSFAFDNLRPGTYTVTQPSQPAGTVNGSTLPGVLGGSATPVATTPSAVAGIVLPPGGQATGNLFAELANSPDLLVAIGHSPATLTVGHGATWPVTVRNAGNLDTSGTYTVEGRLPTGVTLAALPSGNGWLCTGVLGGSSFSCASSTVLAPGATHPGAITVPTAVGAAAAPLSPVSAWVLVEGGGEIDARRPDAAGRGLFASNPGALPVCQPSIAHNVCREPAPVQLPGAVSGTVWLDSGPSSRQLDSGDRRLPGFVVEVVDPASGSLLASTPTGADGSWRVDGLLPGTPMQVRFREPGSGVVFGYPVNGDTGPGSSGASCASGLPPAGSASSCVGSGASPFLSVVLAAGQTLPQQSLPIVPSGVVYDSVSRSPVAGATVLLAPTGSCPGWNPATGIVGAGLGGYTVVAGSGIAMNTGAEGLYQFVVAPGAPASCSFALTVTPPAGYVAPSVIIPAAATPLVPAGAAGSTLAVQPQASAPTGAVGPATLHHLLLSLGSGVASVVNNHLPLDPVGPTGISLSKTGDKAQAEVGDSLRYTITVAFPPGPRPRQTTVVDQLPHGFTYIAGTALVNGVRIADPAGGLGPRLAFQLGAAPSDGRLVLQYRVRVAVGAQQGDGINRARAHSCPVASGCVGPDFAPLPGSLSSNEGQHRVQVRGGVFTTDACVLGKVFVDCNGNHVQDAEELGIPGVRFVLSDGTTLVSDSEGKYSMCGLPARSHVLRADPLTLPRGARLSTSSNRNLGDAGSLWLDLKHGELHRADFVEGSCSNTVLEQTKARRAQGEVRAPETEKRGVPALRFDSKAHGLDALRSPQQGTDGANQATPQPRATTPVAPANPKDESNVPTHQLPMNRPPPSGRATGTAPAPADPAASAPRAAQGGAHGTR